MSELKYESTVTEVTKVFDLSHIDWTKYPKPSYIKSNAFTVDDLTIRLRIAPYGVASTPPGRCSVYFKILNGSDFQNDPRKLLFWAKCDSTKHSPVVASVSECANRIWGRRFATDELISCSTLQITLKLNYNPSFVYRKPSITFEEQLRKMHKFNESMGDITLLVNINENENESYDLYVPQKKKQKRNHDNDSEKGVHRIKACSLILKSASNVFERMLDPNNNMMEFQKKEIIMHAQHVDDVYDLLHFMSTNILKTDCNVLNLIHLAHFYDMDRLLFKCINRLIKNVSVDNFVKTIHTFDRYEITEGYNSLVQFAKDNVDELKNADDFLQLSHSFRCGTLLLTNKK